MIEPQPRRRADLPSAAAAHRHARQARRSSAATSPPRPRPSWSGATSPATAGGMSYDSGLKLDAVEPQYAMALNALLRAGVLRKEIDSLDKKNERMLEREQLRKSQKRVIPTSSGIGVATRPAPSESRSDHPPPASRCARRTEREEGSNCEQHGLAPGAVPHCADSSLHADSPGLAEASGRDDGAHRRDPRQPARTR